MEFAIYDADTHEEVVGTFKNILHRRIKQKMEELIDKGASNYYISFYEKCEYTDEETIDTMNLDEYLERIGFDNV